MQLRPDTPVDIDDPRADQTTAAQKRVTDEETEVKWWIQTARRP